MSDPYTNWNAITLTAEGSPTTVTVTSGIAPPTTAVLSGLTDLNGDGIVTVTISGPIWVLNGLEFVTGGTGGLPAAP